MSISQELLCSSELIGIRFMGSQTHCSKIGRRKSGPEPHSFVVTRAHRKVRCVISQTRRSGRRWLTINSAIVAASPRPWPFLARTSFSARMFKRVVGTDCLKPPALIFALAQGSPLRSPARSIIACQNGGQN
jgi:hypothetical protein